MKIRSVTYSLAILLAAVPALAAPVTSASDFTVPTATKIPGATLQPGSYTIQVLNRLSDRVILKVDSVSGDLHSTFIGVQTGAIAKPSSAGPIRWTNSVDGSDYMKGWFFPGTSTVVEFVYPKADAVAIATANPAKVPAVDPASEGKVTDNTLSQDDMQLLTLWMLSLEQVGPGSQSPSIKAVRYQETASVSHKPVIAALPHTASLLPWVWIVGLCSLLVAATLRFMFQRPIDHRIAKSSR